MKRIRYASLLGLLLIFAFYARFVWSLTPTNYFGLTEDDSLYFSSGKALAEGHGYILPSLPGSPPATKYPILYPWLMSLVWRASRSFPQNLKIAIAFNVACGFVFLGVAFAFLRTIRELTVPERLAVTALCAVHPMVLFHSANILPEIPFAALSLGAITLATRAVSPDGGEFESAASGVLSGLSLLTRTLGLPIAAGLFLATMARAKWRKSVYFVSGVLPFAAFSFWRSVHVVTASSPDAAPPCSNVVRMSWLYYTSYLGFWKADVLPGGGLLHVLKQNVLLLLLQPGAYLVAPSTVRPAALAFAPAVILSVAAIRGLSLRLGAEKWQPAHFALALYAIPLLLWNYPVMERFLLLFLPLFIAGVWLEGKALLRRIVIVVRHPRPAGPAPQTGAAVFLGVVMLAVAFSGARSYWNGATVLWQTSAARRTLFSGKREAYAWLERNTPPQTKVVAYEDAALYLYTNRQGIRPVIFSPSGVVHPEHLEAELACVTAMGATLGATYWMVADDDFGFEWEPAVTRGRKREAQFEAVLPQVFRSLTGDVRLYRLQTVTNPAYQALGDRH
jgi:hypothetical protein